MWTIDFWFALRIISTLMRWKLCDLDFYGPPVELETVDDDLLLGFDLNIQDRTVKYRQPEFGTVFLRDLSASDWAD